MISNLLYDYQLDAANKMRNGCILNGGVGSGKSRTSLYYYCKINGSCNGNSIDTSIKHYRYDLYIITTAKKRDSGEFENDMLPFLLSTNKDISNVDNKIVVDSWNNIKKYIDVKNAFFIFDEQRLTGKGVWVKSFLKISKANKWILLTATPGDNWIDYIPVFMANGFFKSRSEFYAKHVTLEPYTAYTKYPKIKEYRDTGILIRARNAILINMDFDRKTNRIENEIICNYDKILYKSVMHNRFNPFTFEPIENASELLYALREIVNSDESRRKVFRDLIADREKTIVFYNFDYELKDIRDCARECNIKFAQWNGHGHEAIPKCSKWVYAVQYMAGAEGWNCIETDSMIFYSQTYSYKTMEQAKGRIDRLNTPYTNLYYYTFLSKSPIDLAIRRCLSNKRDFNERSFCKNNKI